MFVSYVMGLQPLSHFSSVHVFVQSNRTVPVLCVLITFHLPFTIRLLLQVINVQCATIRQSVRQTVDSIFCHVWS